MPLTTIASLEIKYTIQYKTLYSHTGNLKSVKGSSHLEAKV